MHEIVARRGRQRDKLIATARDYAAGLAARLELAAAVVAGSVARGDFNVWSDIDVVVVAAELPERAPDRSALLLEGAPPRVQPIGYTASELAWEWRRGNPLVREAVEHGVLIWGSKLPLPGPSAGASI